MTRFGVATTPTLCATLLCKEVIDLLKLDFGSSGRIFPSYKEGATLHQLR